MLIPFGPEHFAFIVSWVDSPELMFQYSGPDFPYPWTKERLATYIETVHDRDRFMYEHHGEMIGYGEVLYNGAFQPRLGRLLIGPKAQRKKGHGARMLRELIEYVKRTKGDQRIYLYVFTDNDSAIRSYLSAGFVKTHEAPKFIPKLNKSAWLMHFD